MVGFPFLQNWSGTGIKVAVLDTGMDLGHPDFAGRGIISRSFVPGEAVQDEHSHGTHCIGTALGSDRPGTLPRYGIAHEFVDGSDLDARKAPYYWAAFTVIGNPW